MKMILLLPLFILLSSCSSTVKISEEKNHLKLASNLKNDNWPFIFEGHKVFSNTSSRKLLYNSYCDCIYEVYKDKITVVTCGNDFRANEFSSNAHCFYPRDKIRIITANGKIFETIFERPIIIISSFTSVKNDKNYFLIEDINLNERKIKLLNIKGRNEVTFEMKHIYM